MSALDQYLSIADPSSLEEVRQILIDYNLQIEREIQEFSQLFQEYKTSKVDQEERPASPNSPIPSPTKFKLTLTENCSDLESYKYKVLMNLHVDPLPISFVMTNEYFILDALDKQAPLHHYIANTHQPLNSEMSFSTSLSELPRLDLISHLIKLHDLSQITGIFYKALQYTNLQKSVDELNLPYIVVFEIIYSLVKQAHNLIPKYKNLFDLLMDLVQLDHYFDSLHFGEFFQSRLFTVTLIKVDLNCKTIELLDDTKPVTNILSYFHSNSALFLQIEQNAISQIKSFLTNNKLDQAKELVNRCLFIYSHVSERLKEIYLPILQELIELIQNSEDVHFLFAVYHKFKSMNLTELHDSIIQIRDVLLMRINVHVDLILFPPQSSKLFIFAKQQDWSAHTPDQIARMHGVLVNLTKELQEMYARQFEEALQGTWINRIYDALRKGQVHCFTNTNEKHLIKHHVSLMRGFLLEYLKENVFELTILHLNIIDKAFEMPSYNEKDYIEFKGLPKGDLLQIIKLVFDLK